MACMLREERTLGLAAGFEAYARAAGIGKQPDFHVPILGCTSQSDALAFNAARYCVVFFARGTGPAAPVAA